MTRWLAVVALVAVGVAVGLALRQLDTDGRTDGRAATVSGAAGAREVPQPSPAPLRFTVSVSGDILIHSPVWANALANSGDGSSYDFAPMFEQIRPYVAGADLAICHLETPVTSAAPSGFPIFSAPLDLIDGIKKTGWDACDTASNHSLDQELSGIEETVRALRQAGIAQAGSAFSERGSRRITLLEAGPVTLGFLAYTDQTNGIPLPEPWAVNLLAAADPAVEKARRVAQDTRRAVAAGADAVLVSMQWGDENSSVPNDSQVDLARAVTRIPRVLAIAGHGPHVVQPIRRVRDKFVVFSSGNLLSNQSAPARLPSATQDGLIALLRVVVRERKDGEPLPEGAVEAGDRVITMRRVDYVPTWVRLADHLVEPVGWGLSNDPANAAALRESWERTVAVAGRGSRVAPVPRRLP